MSVSLRESVIEVNGANCRVWEKGSGESIGYLAGFGGLPRWTPFLDRLAEVRRVIVPSLPGFPGGSGHDQLHTPADWTAATLGLLDGAGLAGADLMGVSIGGMLAAEVAALATHTVRRLILLAPFGLFDPLDPVTDVFAQTAEDLPALLCGRFETAVAQLAPPAQADPAEWAAIMARASEAAARLTSLAVDRGLATRLQQIRARTLLIWGSWDRVVPPIYGERFAVGITGPTTRVRIKGAGHLADLDEPDATAKAVLDFLAEPG